MKTTQSHRNTDRKQALLLAAAVVMYAISAPAQNYNSLINPVWHVSLPKSDLVVSVNSISSVLLQEYQLNEDDKQYVVTELNIETTGGNNTRIFFRDKPKEKPTETDANVGGVKISSLEIAEKAKQMAQASNLPVTVGENKTETNSGGRMVKNGLPEIYAKLIQVEATSAAQVRELHDSLLQKWLPND